MTGRKTRALKVPPGVPYKALGKFSKALHGTTGGTYSARVFRPVIIVAIISGRYRETVKYKGFEHATVVFHYVILDLLHNLQ